jgi:uncharacterized protein YbaP (TraB family)
MKNIFAWLTGLLSLFISSAAIGQHFKEGNTKSLLWTITGNHLTKTSYLFGTIHMICAEDYLWTNNMKNSLAKSEKVCFEMDLDDPSVMIQVAAGLIDSGSKKLKDYFTPEQYLLLTDYVRDSLGLDIALFEKMKPIALQSVIGTSGLNCSNPISYEDSIMKTALQTNKEIIGLEDPGEQLAALESIPVDSVVEQLMEALKIDKKIDSEYSNLISAYKKQDLQLLYKLITTSGEMAGGLNVFLDDRNVKWIPRMTSKMNTSSVFFAVGAGHLWGEMGVISLLQKAGYTLKPVN